MSKEELVKQINQSLDKVRPYLIADGGNVEFVEINEQNEVYVKLTGACGTCPFSVYTMKAGVETTLRQDIPEITQVIAVE